MHAERVPARPDVGIEPPAALLHVGLVIHSRRAPRVHRFTHRVFFARFNLDTVEQAQNRLFRVNRAAPFSLQYADYGPGDGTPPRDWIEPLLFSQGVRADGPIVLQTFPRVFGYVFNPVSFWYCHDATGALRAVIAEVNNTFGERHCYLVAHPDGRPLRDGEVLAARKVFHVSPFLPLGGRYDFRFHWSTPRVLARVEYRDAASRLALTTSISGVAQPWSERALLKVLCTHPLFTLGVIARIHVEALRLWIKGVAFHRKPAPPAHSLTRTEP